MGRDGSVVVISGSGGGRAEPGGYDAVAEFGADAWGLRTGNGSKGTASGSMQTIGMATRRIIALHLCEESVTRAAKFLAMPHGSLSDWLARRSLPGKVDMSDDEDGAEG